MGKKARRRQAATMREMNTMAQEQFEYFQENQEEQQAILDKQKQNFRDFQFENPFADIKNPYADLKTEFENLYEGMENPYEDLTVNMRAAEFQAEQGAQQRANILSNLQGAAGSSGIAGLAQALANQGSAQAQQISANIAQQETMNQRLAARGAQQVQQMETAGAERARALGISREQLVAQGGFKADVLRQQGAAAVQQAEFGRESTLLGIDYGLLAGANQAEQQAMANQMSSMGMQANMYGSQAAQGASMFSSIVGAAATVLGGPIGGAVAQKITSSDRRLKKNINLIGKSPSGLNIYSFEYKNNNFGNGTYQGVMSNEIPKYAVSNKNGYDMVDYSMIDVEFKQI